ncbi:hypothetical protein HK104_002948 [Borealophlyctis nickersoniae]|nr:hypothetical protein HK104_002948 [Borealophlyctis nickersoniae]
MPFNPLKLLVAIPNDAPIRTYENANVRVQHSPLHKDGLFAKRNFQTGDTILYDTQDECAPINEHGHTTWVFALINSAKVLRIPAADLARLDNPNTPFNEAMDILHAACQRYNSTRDQGANIRFHYIRGHCRVQATTNVAAGSELLRAYAATQWLIIYALWHRSRMTRSCKTFTEQYLTLVDRGARQLTPEDAFYMQVARNEMEWI